MPAPPGGGPALVARLRDDLEASGWTVDAVTERLGPVAAAALLREDAAPARRALAGERDAAAVLTRLFVLGQPVERGELDGALPGLGAAGARALSLVDAAGSAREDAVRAAVDLRPHAAGGTAGRVPQPTSRALPVVVEDERHWWIASDLGEGALAQGPAPSARPVALPVDHVLGVGGASTTLLELTPRVRAGRVLDLGTGCGVQALHAAHRAGAVVATDTSARALAFAGFNAALAGTTLDLRAGSLLDPVAGERFDQVVSNPPFVVTPRAAGVPGWEYRDGGLVGDEVVRRLVTGVGGVLAPGGTAVMLANWEHRAGEGWRDRVGSWLDDSGLDAWVVQREVADPAEYAETWIRDGGLRPGAVFDALVGAWLDDFAARGVEAVGLGFVVLRAPLAAGATPRARWRRVEEATGPLALGAGAHVAAVLAAHEALAGLDDAGLARQHLVVADDVTEERHARPGEAGPRVILLRRGGGLGRAVSADTALAGVVGACDGDLALGALVGAVAALLEVDAGALAADVLPRVRDLVADGFLELAR